MIFRLKSICQSLVKNKKQNGKSYHRTFDQVWLMTCCRVSNKTRLLRLFNLLWVLEIKSLINCWVIFWQSTWEAWIFNFTLKARAILGFIKSVIEIKTAKLMSKTNQDVYLSASTFTRLAFWVRLVVRMVEKYNHSPGPGPITNCSTEFDSTLALTNQRS